MRDRGAGAVEAGGGLDEVEVRGGREHAAGDDVVGGQLGGLEDEFELDGVWGLEAEGGEFLVDGCVGAGLELGVVDYDVEFAGAGLEGEFGLSEGLR